MSMYNAVTALWWNGRHTPLKMERFGVRVRLPPRLRGSRIVAIISGFHPDDRSSILRYLTMDLDQFFAQMFSVITGKVLPFQIFSNDEELEDEYDHPDYD